MHARVARARTLHATDIEVLERITRKRGENCAKQLGISYIETSAKTGLNVEEMFRMIANEIYGNLDLSDIDVYISSRERESNLGTESSCNC